MPLVPENSKGFDDFIKDPTGKEGMRRTAADLGVAGKKWPSADEIKGMIKQGGFADSFNTPIQFLDPAYFDPILFFIQHRDRKELNFRLRYYYEYDEVVGPCIDLHSEFPLSDFHLQCGDQTIQRHFMELKDRIELMNLLTDTAKDYWLLGEAIPYGRWNDSEKTWDFFSLLPPEKVEFRSTYITPNPIIVLQVDDQLKKLVSSQDEIDKAILTMLDPVIVDKIKSETHIVLPQWQVSHFCRKTSRTDLRGTSIVKRALKPLLYKDKLRLLQFTFVDRHMFPLKIFKLGNPQTGWIPTRAHFETLRDLLAQAANDPDFNIIFHHGLQVDYVGTKDKIENLIPHFDWCDAQIMKALFTNKAVVEGQGVCWHPDAQILTEDGFKHYWEVDPKEKLATFNKETGALEYQQYVDKTVMDYDGDLIHFKTGKIDAMVTPNHRMWVQPRYGEGHGPWQEMKAEDVKNRAKFRCCVDDWQGTLIPDPVICGQPIPLRKFVEFIGYYASEGWTRFAPERRTYHVGLSQNSKSRGFNRIQALCMKELPLTFHAYTYGDAGQYNFIASSKEFAEYMRQYLPGKSVGKFIPKDIKNLPKEYLRILLDALVCGDGYIKHEKDGQSYSFVYTTISPRLRDDVTEILLKLGYAPTSKQDKGRNIHRVFWSESNIGRFPLLHSYLGAGNTGKESDVITRVPYRGKVWCFTVPNDALITRYNGKISCHLNTYANANVSVRVLMHRYMTLRSKLELMVNNKIFYQVAKARGYYIPDRTGNTGRQSVNINGKYMILDLPKFRWQKLNLLDDTTQKNFLMRLREKMEVPHKLISEIFDLEESDMRAAMEEEDGTVVDPVYVDARKKTAQQDFVRDQVIRHKKTKDWVLTQSKAQVEKEKPGTKPARETPTQDIETQSVPGEAPVGGGTPPAGEGNSAKPPTETPGGTPPPAAH